MRNHQQKFMANFCMSGLWIVDKSSAKGCEELAENLHPNAMSKIVNISMQLRRQVFDRPIRYCYKSNDDLKYRSILSTTAPLKEP